MRVAWEQMGSVKAILCPPDMGSSVTQRHDEARSCVQAVSPSRRNPAEGISLCFPAPSLFPHYYFWPKLVIRSRAHALSSSTDNCYQNNAVSHMREGQSGI